LGGIVSTAAQRFLKQRGVRPQLEAPEVTPTPREFRPQAVVREKAPFIEREIPEVLGGTKQELLVREARQRRLARQELREIQQQMIEQERQGLSVEANNILNKVSVGEKPARTPISWDQVYTKLLDDLHPINVATGQLTEMLGRGTKVGKRLPPIEDPYILARLTRGSVGKATSFLETGPLNFKTLQPVGPGLKQILQPIMGTGRMEALRAFLVSRRAIELDKRGIKTPFDTKDAKAVVEQAEPLIRDAAQAIDGYQLNVMKYLEDSGLIGREQSLAMRQANRAYVPFYRFIEDPSAPPTPVGPRAGGRRMANLRTGIRRIKGGEKLPVVDPLESIVRNTYAFVQLADRQAVSKALVDLAERYRKVSGEYPSHIIEPTKPGLKAIELAPQELKKAQSNLREVMRIATDISEEDLIAFASDGMTIFRPSEVGRPGLIWVMREGKRKFFEVDDDLFNALLDVGRERTPQVLSLLSFPARLLRAGATLSPRFIIRNPFRDQFTAAVFSKHGFKPGFDLLRGIFHVMERDRLYQQFKRSGGEYSTLVRTTAAERKNLQKSLDELLREDNVLSGAWRTTRNPKGWIEGLRVLSETMENASRAREFMRAMEQTGDPRLAGFASREVTLDFARMGTKVQVLNQIIPFFNASLQGTDKLVRTFKDNPYKAAALASTYITMPSLALYAINHDDENYQELSDARKDFFWNIPLVEWNNDQGRFERTGGFFSVPKPFDLGMIFGAGAERTAEWIKNNDPEGFEAWANNFLESFVPSMLPTAIVPPIEAVTNFSFFRRRPIIPEREKDLLPEEQAGPLQGETARLLGKALGVSPRLVENTVRGYTGGLGEGALAFTDLVLERLGVEGSIEPRAPTERAPLVGPLISQFLVREPTVSSKSVERFYRNWEQISAVQATVRRQISEGRGQDASNLVQVSTAEMAGYRLYLETSQAIAKTRQAMSVVRTNKDIPREEREQRLLVLGRVIRTLAKNANDAYKKIRDALNQSNQQLKSSVGSSSVPLLVSPGSVTIPPGEPAIAEPG
jgi:hypothetical protein